MRIRSPLPHKKTRIEIIPLIDIMFFLLASFMMVSLQMQKLRTIRASLPTATMAPPTGEKKELVNLKVNADGRVLMDKVPIQLTDLYSALTNKVAADTNVPVYITGHREASHGAMVYVLDLVKRAGVQKVAFNVTAIGD